METVQTSLLTEKELIIHAVDVLEKTSPINKPRSSKDIPKSVAESLDELFPEQRYTDKELQKAKNALGKLAKEFSDIELRGAIAEVQFLAEVWLDDFERRIFKGLTLKELLHEKGGL